MASKDPLHWSPSIHCTSNRKHTMVTGLDIGFLVEQGRALSWQLGVLAEVQMFAHVRSFCCRESLNN